MKTMWETPRINVEQFVPEESVAVCWGVECDVEASNDWEWSHKPEEDHPDSGFYDPTYTWGTINTWNSSGQPHSETHCGDYVNQVIKVDSEGYLREIQEVGTDGLGKLTGTVYTDDTFKTVASSSQQYSLHDSIYWTTSSGFKVWHHIGTIIAKWADAPNKSS